MADHIPFITSKEGADFVKRVYPDSDIVRIPLALDRAGEVCPPLLPATTKVWLHPCVDGMHDPEKRHKTDNWLDFVKDFPHFEKIGTPAYHAKPDAAEVYAFVKAIMDKCATQKPTPAWITVPQLPLVTGSARNIINRALARATGKWKSSSSSFSGRLILPLVLTNQAQTNKKQERTKKVQQAEWCYREAGADGLWVVDASLTDDNGPLTMRKRFRCLIALHEELNDRSLSKIRIAGPYWALNLVLWSRGLVDYPAIGVSSGYQYFLPGGLARSPTARIALPSLRRRVGVGPQLRIWLDAANARLAPSHPAHVEFSEIRKQYTELTGQEQAREQVARFYKEWFNIIAAVPRAGRSMALFQDLSAAFALGRSLPALGAGERAARRPEAVAEPLMLSCL